MIDGKIFLAEACVSDSTYLDTARYYCVDDLPGASQPAARLQSILQKLRSGSSLTPFALAFLEAQNLTALRQFITGDVTYEGFRAQASIEQDARIKATNAAQAAKEVAAHAREMEMQRAYELDRAKARAERARLESDPRHLAKVKSRELRKRFGIQDYVDDEHFATLMGILRKADAGNRFSEVDVAWLSSAGEEYFTHELWTAYHRTEALALSAEFKTTDDPWKAITASGHYRKCAQPNDADQLLSTVRIDRLGDNKIKSAFCTTRGGVMRDLGKLIEAKALGEKAHVLKPRDFRPCTLLGAVHTELGELHLGREWYEKAVARGATPDSVDKDIRSIYCRADEAMKAKLREFLLSQDAARYGWVVSKGKHV